MPVNIIKQSPNFMMRTESFSDVVNIPPPFFSNFQATLITNIMNIADSHPSQNSRILILADSSNQTKKAFKSLPQGHSHMVASLEVLW